jgi:tetratricopeptide (TPR) repeat protein
MKLLLSRLPAIGVLSLVALALMAASARFAAADLIVLTNGHTIEADRAWVDGSQVRYERNGGTFGVPRSLVQRIDTRASADATGDRYAAAARGRLAVGDVQGAQRLLDEALSRDPRSVPALQLSAEIQLSRGEFSAARATADRAIRLNDRDPRLLDLRGQAAQALGDRRAAEADYRRCLEFGPNPDVQRRLAEMAPSNPGRTTHGAQLRIQFDGSLKEPLGSAVLAELTASFESYRRILGAAPTLPVTVVLQTNAEFHEDIEAPEWAAGINNGTIYAPVGGLERPTEALLRVLRHELAHSFVNSITQGNCPTWLHEGVAQWLEGGDPARHDAIVARLAQQHRLVALAALEGPFRNLPIDKASVAYAESLAAVNHILRSRGEEGVTRLLAALADGIPAEEALVVSLAVSYPEFQQGWERQLLAAASVTPTR